MTEGSTHLAALLAQPVRSTPPEELTQLFDAAAKDVSRWRLGLELELFPFRKEGLGAVDYDAVVSLFEGLAAAAAAGETLTPELDPGGHPIGLAGDGEVVSLEPGGQIEYATRPYRRLRELLDATTHFARRLVEVGSERGLGFWALGRHPFHDVASVPKMPKNRYDVMRAYLPQRGARGLEMMHLTASVQCAVDFSDEANMIAKIRTAARMAPFLAALASSSPFSRGRPNGLASDRYAIWFETDPARSGLWPEMVDAEGLGFLRYVRRALATPAMFFRREGRYVVAEPRPFSAYAEAGFGGTEVTVADFVDHLTSLFPELRIKNYLELRTADCLPPAEAVALAGIWRGVLDDEPTRRRIDGMLAPLDFEALTRLQRAVAERGLAAMSPVGPVRDVALALAQAAHRRYLDVSPDCATCVVPLLERAERGRSLADDLLAAAERGSIADALALVTLAP